MRVQGFVQQTLAFGVLGLAAMASVGWGQQAPVPDENGLPTIDIPGDSPGVPSADPLEFDLTEPFDPFGPMPTAGAQPPAAATAADPTLLNFPTLGEIRLAPGASGVTRGATGSLFDTPGLTTVVTQQDLIERGATSMFDALRYEVGIQVQRTAAGQAAPYVRGLTGQQVLIAIDGIRLNNSTFRTGPNQYFNTIDPGQVQQIEVIRGPASVMYGSDAIGGAINVVTRSPDLSRDYAGGSFRETFSTADTGSYTRMSIEGHVERFGMFGGGSYLNVNDLQTGGPLGRQDWTGYSQYAGDLKLTWDVGDRGLFTVAMQHFEQMNVPRSDRFFPFIPLNQQRPTFFDPQQRNLVYSRLEFFDLGGALMDDFAVTASYSRQKEGSRTTDTRGTRDNLDIAEFDVNNVGLNLQAARDFEEYGRLTYGTDWFRDEISAFRNRFRASDGGFVSPLTPQFPDDAFYERFGAFLYWNVDLNDWLNFQAGTRYEHIKAGGTPIVQVNGQPTPLRVDETFQDWISSGALTVRLTDDVHLIGSISQGFRAPNLDDLVATNPFVQQAGTDLPSVMLGPERAINYEVGFKVDRPIWRAQAFYFWTDLQDNILRAPQTDMGDPLFERVNRDSYVHGFEITQELLLTDTWAVWGNYFYTYGRDEIELVPLSRIPPQQGSLGLRYRTLDRRSWFDVFVWMVDAQSRLAPQDISDARIPDGGTPAFATLNLRTGTTFGQRNLHRVGMVLENLTNTAYRVHGSGVDGPGINGILTYEFIR